MNEEIAMRQQRLSDSIEQRQQAIQAYLRRARPRRDRLVSTSVVGSALAAALTAGPAFGGIEFTTAVQGIFSLEESSVVWRVLCLGAVLLSLAAALATNLANSHSVADKVSTAEACKGQLEGLRTVLDFGSLATNDAVQLYQQYVAGIGFIDELPSRRDGKAG